MDADYQQVNDALEAVDAQTDAAEAQALLCGMASASATPDKAAWVAQVLADTAPRGEPAKKCLEALVALHDNTMRGLDDEDMRFQLLLPDDSAPLPERTQALKRWVSGFLVGLGIGGLKQETPLPDEVSEALRDMDAITQIDIEAGGEEDEGAFAELVEYVKVATLLVRANLRPHPKPTSTQEKPSGRLH